MPAGFWLCLVTTKRPTKRAKDYAHNVTQAIIANQMAKVGFDVGPGKFVSCIITGADNRSPERRVVVYMLMEGRMRYNVRKYCELVYESTNEPLSSFVRST